MSTDADKERGRIAYELDRAAAPTYPNGDPRPDWDRLPEAERWGWYYPRRERRD